MNKINSRNFKNPYVRAALAILISAITLFLAVRNVSISDILTAIKGADLRFVLLGLASVSANTLAKTVRWKVLLGEIGEKVSLWVVFQAILIGQTLNNIYPARVGDLSRIYVVGDRGPGRVYTLGTIILEKVLDTLFYAVLVVYLLVTLPLPGWISGWANESVFILTGTSLIVGLVLILIAYHPSLFFNLFDRVNNLLTSRYSRINLSKTRNWLQAGMDSLEVIKNQRRLGLALFWLVVSWVTALLNNQLALLALGIHLPLTASLLVLVVLQAGISIPSVPGRIGVFEYISVLCLAVFGISRSIAFSYGVLLHSLVFILPGLLGLYFLVLQGLTIRNGNRAQASTDDL